MVRSESLLKPELFVLYLFFLPKIWQQLISVLFRSVVINRGYNLTRSSLGMVNPEKGRGMLG